MTDAAEAPFAFGHLDFILRFGIRVSIIEPGPIETPIWRKGLVHKRESLDGMSDTLLGLYGSAMEKSINSMRKVEKNAGPVGLVIRAVDHALNAKNPKVRYVVGRRAKTVLSITKVLPDRLQDRIFDLMA